MSGPVGDCHPHPSPPADRGGPIGARRSGRARDESGQILVFFLILSTVLVTCLFLLFNMGKAVEERMRLQNIADRAAYSQAVWEARCLNFMAYTNRAMVSQAVTIHFLTAVESNEQMWHYITTHYSPATFNIPVLSGESKDLWETFRQIHGRLNVDTELRKKIWEKNETVHSSIALLEEQQQRFYSEMVDALAGARIPKEVLAGAGGRSPSVDETSEAGGRVREANLSGFKAAFAADGEGNLKPDFDAWKDVFERSLGPFSRGDVYPRTAEFWIPPREQGEVHPLDVRSRVLGKNELQEGGFFQQDRFYYEYYENGWQPLILHHLLPEFKSLFEAPLSKLRFAHLPAASRRKDFRVPSYSLLLRPGGKIAQVGGWGLPSAPDLRAVSKAEVYYDDPEKKERPPNLFNAFWNARLSPVVRAEDPADPGREILRALTGEYPSTRCLH